MTGRASGEVAWLAIGHDAFAGCRPTKRKQFHHGEAPLPHVGKADPTRTVCRPNNKLPAAYQHL